ncbi:MAG: hypothetical protein KGL90_15420 [Burkholderiales bacterium]|nr:hypothetical protein [Burkholderiales bacterium]
MDITTVLLRDGRKLGGIIPDVVIEEVHADTLTITDHPVEQGAAITDHAFKNPAELTMRIGWSAGSVALNGVISGVVSGTLLTGKLKTVRDVYDDLLKLQASRQPFDVSTGKRLYTSMLIRSLAVTTDAATENALVATVVLRQIIIVQTKAAKLKASALKSPSKTGPVANLGSVQPAAVSSAQNTAQFLKLP